MPKQKFSLKNAEQVRVTTTMAQQKRIKKMYEKLYQDVTKQITKLGNKNLQKQNLVLLQRDIENAIQQMNDDIQNGIVRDMRIVSNAVVEDTRTFLKQMGFKDKDIHNAFQYVPDQIVKNIINGNIYQDGWSLSQAIRGYNKKTQQDLINIIGICSKQGKSAYETSLELERYVDPSARKASRVISSWRYDNNGNKVKDKFYFGKVDYNAQRLARTMISHAYQQSFEAVNKNDPFVTGYRWLISNFHGRVCEICREREGKIYKKDELPLDHPNGMCTFEAVIPDSMTDIATKIGMWYQSPIGTYPEIDEYAKDFIL